MFSMQKDLNYDYETGQDYIKEMMEFEPNIKQYHDFLAKSLDCKIEEIALLHVVPEFEEVDEEGWDLAYFFPEGAKIDVKVLYTNYSVPGLSIGEILEVTYNGEKFIAECNASPYGVYAKYQPK